MILKKLHKKHNSDIALISDSHIENSSNALPLNIHSNIRHLLYNIKTNNSLKNDNSSINICEPRNSFSIQRPVIDVDKVKGLKKSRNDPLLKIKNSFRRDSYIIKNSLNPKHSQSFVMNDKSERQNLFLNEKMNHSVEKTENNLDNSERSKINYPVIKKSRLLENIKIPKFNTKNNLMVRAKTIQNEYSASQNLEKKFQNPFNQNSNVTVNFDTKYDNYKENYAVKYKKNEEPVKNLMSGRRISSEFVSPMTGFNMPEIIKPSTTKNNHNFMRNYDKKFSRPTLDLSQNTMFKTIYLNDDLKFRSKTTKNGSADEKLLFKSDGNMDWKSILKEQIFTTQSQANKKFGIDKKKLLNTKKSILMSKLLTETEFYNSAIELKAEMNQRKKLRNDEQLMQAYTVDPLAINQEHKKSYFEMKKEKNNAYRFELKIIDNVQGEDKDEILSKKKSWENQQDNESIKSGGSNSIKGRYKKSPRLKFGGAKDLLKWKYGDDPLKTGSDSSTSERSFKNDGGIPSKEYTRLFDICMQERNEKVAFNTEHRIRMREEETADYMENNQRIATIIRYNQDIKKKIFTTKMMRKNRMLNGKSAYPRTRDSWLEAEKQLIEWAPPPKAKPEKEIPFVDTYKPPVNKMSRDDLIRRILDQKKRLGESNNEEDLDLELYQSCAYKNMMSGLALVVQSKGNSRRSINN